MFTLLIWLLLTANDAGVPSKATTTYAYMINDCNAVYSKDPSRLREVVLRNNYGFFNNRELCENMAQVIMNDMSSDRLEFSRKHAAISLLLCHVDTSASDVVIDALIRNIQYRDPFNISVMLSKPQHYPCLACLLKIGRKATNKIIYDVANTDDKMSNTLFASWFIIYYGQEEGIAVINIFLQKYSSILTKVQRTRIEAFIEIKMGGTVKK